MVDRRSLFELKVFLLMFPKGGDGLLADFPARTVCVVGMAHMDGVARRYTDASWKALVGSVLRHPKRLSWCVFASALCSWRMCEALNVATSFLCVQLPSRIRRFLVSATALHTSSRSFASGRFTLEAAQRWTSARISGAVPETSDRS